LTNNGLSPEVTTLIFALDLSLLKYVKNGGSGELSQTKSGGAQT
jgi:hypothetical protein